MAIPLSGTLSITDIVNEFADTAPHSLTEFYRGGGIVPDSPANAGIPTSGQIAIGDFYGAQNRVTVPLTISSNTQNYNLYTQASASPLYSAGSSDIELTINSGIYVGSSSTGSYALQVPSGFNPADTVKIVNNGIIIGRGGNGGAGGTYPSSGSGGGTGGYAVYVNRPVTLDNVGTLSGGGGGGGGGLGGGTTVPRPPKNGGPYFAYRGGGGGGGGAGYPGGSGGGGGSVGGGSGSSGSTTSGGSGGAGNPPGRPGGTGGGRGANGSPGNPGAGGGTRGYYLVGSPFVTYESTGTRLGLVS